jgi:hypothetical protein
MTEERRTQTTRERTLMERAEAAKPIRIPETMKGMAADLQRLSARMRARGLEDPFGGDALKVASPKVVRGVLAEAKGLGLLEEDPGWTRRPETWADLSIRLQKSLGQELSQDLNHPRGLGGLGGGL